MTFDKPAAESKPVKRDHRQEVTDSIVRMLEEGVAPWQKPWEATAMPFNPTTDKPYRGGNAVHLLATVIQRGYEDPRWMTYKQAAQNGYQVRQGEKGTHIEFWEVKDGTHRKPAEVEEASEKPDKKTAGRLIHRVYTVFNAKQIDGVPSYEPKQRTKFEAAQSGERILNSSGAIIAHDQRDSAFYSRATDSIHLPPKDAFADAPGYYGMALHELSHWTGHPSRLNRSTLTDSYRFGDTNYAKEELRAELASVFIAAEIGVPHDPANHAAYVGSWIKGLKEDKNEIFRAAHDASAAADYVLSLDRERTRHEAFTPDRPEELTPVQENSQLVARHEPGTGTVAVHDKRSSVDQHTPIEASTVADTATQQKRSSINGADLSSSFSAAKRSLTSAMEAALTRKQGAAGRKAADTRFARAAGFQGIEEFRSSLCLALRQPYAEEIMSGKKKTEYRSRLTHIRGRVLIYASKTPSEDPAEDLPTGMIIGSVEITGCRHNPRRGHYEWKLMRPIRLPRLILIADTSAPFRSAQFASASDLC